MRFKYRFMLFGAVAALAVTASLLGWQQAFAQYPPTIGSLTAAANPSPAPMGSTVDVTCTVRDTSGSPVAGEPCTFTIVSQPGSDASIGSLSVTKNTNSQGVATAKLDTGSTPGTIVVSVEARGISSQVSVTVVGEGAPAQLPTTGGPAPSDSAAGFPWWLGISLSVMGTVATTTFALRAVRRQR